MSEYPDDNLFRESTMTFGEHLEELRRALVKAIIWLFVGFIIGLSCGTFVVEFIKTPLVGALKDHYTVKSAQDYLLLEAEKTRLEGDPPATRKNSADAEVQTLAEQLLEKGWTLREFHVDRNILREAVAPATNNEPSKKETPQPNDANQSEKETSEKTSDPPTPALAFADFVTLPLWTDMSKDDRIDPSAFSVSEAFMFYLKGSLLAGFILASPMIFREMWLFVAAGLYPHERRYVHVFMPFSIALFVSGALFCFFIVFPFILEFLFGFNEMLGISIEPRISEWLSFALILPVGFGLSFQLPLVMLFLQRIGVFTIEVYLAKWRIAVLVIAVISMLLTPADPMSMIAMLVPLTVLYFGGILLCKYMPERKGILEE